MIRYRKRIHNCGPSVRLKALDLLPADPILCSQVLHPVVRHVVVILFPSLQHGDISAEIKKEINQDRSIPSTSYPSVLLYPGFQHHVPLLLRPFLRLLQVRLGRRLPAAHVEHVCLQQAQERLHDDSSTLQFFERSDQLLRVVQPVYQIVRLLDADSANQYQQITLETLQKTNRFTNRFQ